MHLRAGAAVRGGGEKGVCQLRRGTFKSESSVAAAAEAPGRTQAHFAAVAKPGRLRAARARAKMRGVRLTAASVSVRLSIAFPPAKQTTQARRLPAMRTLRPDTRRALSPSRAGLSQTGPCGKGLVGQTSTSTPNFLSTVARTPRFHCENAVTWTRTFHTSLAALRPRRGRPSRAGGRGPARGMGNLRRQSCAPDALGTTPARPAARTSSGRMLGFRLSRLRSAGCCSQRQSSL